MRLWMLHESLTASDLVRWIRDPFLHALEEKGRRDYSAAFNATLIGDQSQTPAYDPDMGALQFTLRVNLATKLGAWRHAAGTREFRRTYTIGLDAHPERQASDWRAKERVVKQEVDLAADSPIAYLGRLALRKYFRQPLIPGLKAPQHAAAQFSVKADADAAVYYPMTHSGLDKFTNDVYREVRTALGMPQRR